jgi:lipopolysaccharide export system protein LptA
VRRLSAPEIRLALAAGAPSEAEAWGGVEIEETLPRRPRRTYRGERGRARFGAGGALAEASLDGAVELQDGKLTATGDRATLERDGELATLLGKPAVGKSERGELSAPKLVYESGPGRLRAEEGARARFHAREGGLPAPADADPREPIHVEAARGAFTLEPKTFEFEGAVQAVQGETLLFADKLTGDQAAGKSTASGHVRTIWQDRPETGPKPPPTTVQAETLDYLREAGELHYRGGVRIRQGAREIRAAECVVELDGEQRAERVRAGGEVRIDDRESGRTVEGEVADYDLAQRAAIVTGDPVTIREKGGTVLQGRRARFDLESGVARLLSELP